MAKKTPPDWPKCNRSVRSKSLPLTYRECGLNAVRVRYVHGQTLYRCGVHSKYDADWKPLKRKP